VSITACGIDEVAYDGVRFIALKLVYKKIFLTDCDYYYKADCVAPYILSLITIHQMKE
jgi:hypothetical protein